MRKRILSLLLAFALVLGMVPVVASADTELYGDTNGNGTVDVYLSISDADLYMIGADSTKPMAMLPVSVPYFDLADYHLEGYYFSSESYGQAGSGDGSALEAGTYETAYGNVTPLHLFIYATELYQCSQAIENPGTGELYELGLLGSSLYEENPDLTNPSMDACAIYISGTVGSTFLNRFWGHDENLMYFKNYEFPLASSGWGSTTDQILLKDGDIVTVGGFDDEKFYEDSTNGIFNYITADPDTPISRITVDAGEELNLTVMHAYESVFFPMGTQHNPVESQPEVYYCKADDVPSADVTDWTLLGTAESDGSITVNTEGWEAGTYIIAIAGQVGDFGSVVSTPGGMLLTVTAPSAPPVVLGDVNGDTEVTAMDVSLTAQKAAGKEVTITTAAADVNGDNAITAMDVSLIAQFAAGKITQFPTEADN